MTPMDYIAPTCDEIEHFARETVAKLPRAFRFAATEVAISSAGLSVTVRMSDFWFGMTGPCGCWR